jgi:hypothetical protein
LKLPGFAVQVVMHEPEQLLVQLASMLPEQPPLQLASSVAEQLTWRFIGVHWAVHPPEVSNVQDSFPERSMLPQSER